MAKEARKYVSRKKEKNTNRPVPGPPPKRETRRLKDLFINTEEVKKKVRKKNKSRIL